MANTWTTLLDAVYPVGAVYMSYNTTSPATLFGGTWSTISGFPWLHTSKTPGATGGEETHTLSTNEMPSHTHPYEFYGVNTGSSIGEWFGKHPVKIYQDYNYNWAVNWGFYLYSAGGDGSHNNLPPYYILRGWRRTA